MINNNCCNHSTKKMKLKYNISTKRSINLTMKVFSNQALNQPAKQIKLSLSLSLALYLSPSLFIYIYIYISIYTCSSVSNASNSQKSGPINSVGDHRSLIATSVRVQHYMNRTTLRDSESLPLVDKMTSSITKTWLAPQTVPCPTTEAGLKTPHPPCFQSLQSIDSFYYEHRF